MLLLKTLPSANGANKGVPSIEEYVQRIQSHSSLSLVTLGFYVDVCSVNLLTYDVTTASAPSSGQSVADFLPTRLTTPLGMLRWYESS